MRLLIFTQAVDKNDLVLGFFHDWLFEFASKFEEITVVALGAGEVSLPSNVKVFSLGKEKRRNKLLMAIKLVFLIWNKRHAGDAVFVHMNKEYVLAGWLIWKISRVPFYLWYNHKYANWSAKLAMKLSKKVFYTSKHSASSKYLNSVCMPVGVNTNSFNITKPISARGRSILSLGRIDPVKKVDVIAKSVLFLEKNGQSDFKMTIAGSPSWGNEKYSALIREALKSPIDKGIVRFVGGVQHQKTVELFNQNKIFINLTSSGSFDKTILEAMSSGCIVISTNEAVKKFIGKEGMVESTDIEKIASNILSSFSLSDEELENRSVLNREFVVKNHSLKLLADKLVSEIKSV